MDFLKRLAERTQAVVDKAEEEFQDGLEHIIKVPSEVREERFSICKECPHLKKLKRCSKCGCFMELKTWLPMSECPIGKWGKHE